MIFKNAYRRGLTVTLVGINIHAQTVATGQSLFVNKKVVNVRSSAAQTISDTVIIASVAHLIRFVQHATMESATIAWRDTN